MKFYNLRIEKYDGKAWLKADMECKFTPVKELWFNVPEEYADYLSDDIYDAILVAALYPAMFYGEAIEIEGCVTEQLYRNISTQMTAILHEWSPSLQQIPIKVCGFAKARKNEKLHVGTGFSGGVDSFCTLQDHFHNEISDAYKIDTIYFFNIGQNGKYRESTTAKRVQARFSATASFTKKIGLPCIMMDCNLFAFYHSDWELSAGVLLRVMSVLLFQRALQRYYISSAYTYRETVSYPKHFNTSIASYADQLVIALLSPPMLDIICDGIQYTRCEKTANIVDAPLAQQHLNVCVNYEPEFASGKNCSRCSKCLRTLVTLDSMGRLDDFSEVFDLDVYQQHAYRYKCEQRLLYREDAFAHDNVDFAERNGRPFPSEKEALNYMKEINQKKLLPRIKRKLKAGIKKAKHLILHH